MEEKEINAIINSYDSTDNSETVEDFFDLDDFHNLDIWQEAIELAVKVNQLVQLLPPDEGLFLADQMNSAATAIPTNIAQGKARGNNKDFQKFLLHAFDSIAELETYLSICNVLYVLAEEQTAEILDSCQQLREAMRTSIDKIEPEKNSFAEKSSSPRHFDKKHSADKKRDRAPFDKKSSDKKPFRKKSFDIFATDDSFTNDFSERKSSDKPSYRSRSEYSSKKRSFKNNFTKKNISWNDKKSTRKK